MVLSGSSSTVISYRSRSERYSFCSASLRRALAHSRTTAALTASSGGTLPLLRSVTKTKCCPKVEAIGPCHRPCSTEKIRRAKPSPNVLATSRWRNGTELRTEQERIAKLRRSRRCGAAGNCGPDLLQILIDRIGAACRTEKHVMERKAVFGPETIRIGGEKGRKLAFGRFGDRNLFGQKLHLLPHAAADDDVIAIKPGCSSRAVEDFVANIILDQVLQFLLARRSPPRPRKSIRKVGDPRSGNNNLFRRLRASLVNESIEGKQDRTQHQELKQRLSEQPGDQGVYQIGDV